jgi:hypothetical protein
VFKSMEAAFDRTDGDEGLSSWPLGFSDCLRFVTSDGDSACCPYFMYTTFCPCISIGKIRTLELRERSICCGMGLKGLGLCLKSFPLNMILPFGGCCYFISLGKQMREQVLNDYKMTDDAELSAVCCKIPSSYAGI